MPVILALGKLRQEGQEFEARLGYIATLSQKAKKKGNKESLDSSLNLSTV
jgi:hypothetical protein